MANGVREDVHEVGKERSAYVFPEEVDIVPWADFFLALSG